MVIDNSYINWSVAFDPKLAFNSFLKILIFNNAVSSARHCPLSIVFCQLFEGVNKFFSTVSHWPLAISHQLKIYALPFHLRPTLHSQLSPLN